ncbi:hypothetical protein EBR21_02765 [bacterium]|nr:hypothetical protein [bacterium]
MIFEAFQCLTSDESTFLLSEHQGRQFSCSEQCSNLIRINPELLNTSGRTPLGELWATSSKKNENVEISGNRAPS